MTVCRALPVVVLIVAIPFAAAAQFGGAPGTLPPGFGGPPVVRPPACQQLLALRDEVQKHGIAIKNANQRKAPLPEACKLFKAYLAAETKFMKGLEENGRSCGAPPEVLTQVKESHTKASQIGKEVCEVAARGPGPASPSPRDMPRLDFRKPGQFRHYDDSCELCGKTGDFGWPDGLKR